MDPFILYPTFNDISSLSHRNWLMSSIIDLWVLFLWKTTTSPKFVYIPMHFIPAQVEHCVTDEEIDNFRSFFTLPPRDTPCPYKDLIYAVHGGKSDVKSGNHFFLAVFMPQRKLIYILGQDYTIDSSNKNSQDWGSWNGEHLWTRICGLFGWVQHDPSLFPMQLAFLNWTQNGYDCGPTLCQMAQHLMQHGMILDDNLTWDRPIIACFHPFRKVMAQGIHKLVVDGCKKFDDYNTQHTTELLMRFHPPEEYIGKVTMFGALTVLLQQPGPNIAKTTIRSLEISMRRCQPCHDISEVIREKEAAKENPIPIRRRHIQERSLSNLKSRSS